MTRRRHGITLAALAAALLTVAAAAPAQAQYYRARPRYRGAYKHRPHLYLGGQLSGIVITGQDVPSGGFGYLKHGGGFGLTVGGRLGRWVSLEGTWNFTVHDQEYVGPFYEPNYLWLSAITGDVKVHIPTWIPLEPYLQAGGGFVVVGATHERRYEGRVDTIFTTGPMINLGGGVDLWLGRHLTIGARLLYKGYFLGEQNVNDNRIKRFSNFVSATALDVTAAFHF